MGSCIIVVGGTGTGKTTFVHEKLRKVNKNSLFIYDVNNEYKEFTRGNPLPDREVFTDLGMNTENGVFVFEEATIYFKNKSTDEKLTEILVRKRHTNNTIFLVFHSLGSIPKYIYQLSNYIVLFKTNDSVSDVKQKFGRENFINAFNEVQSNPDKHYKIIYKNY